MRKRWGLNAQLTRVKKWWGAPSVPLGKSLLALVNQKDVSCAREEGRSNTNGSSCRSINKMQKQMKSLIYLKTRLFCLFHNLSSLYY